MSGIIPYHSESLKLIEKLRGKAIASLKDLKIEEVEGAECLALEQTDLKHLRQILDTWVESLSACPNDAVRHGIASGLLEFDAYLAEAEKLLNKVFNEVNS